MLAWSPGSCSGWRQLVSCRGQAAVLYCYKTAIREAVAALPEGYVEFRRVNSNLQLVGQPKRIFMRLPAAAVLHPAGDGWM